MNTTYLVRRNKSKKQREAVSKYWKGRSRNEFLDNWRKGKILCETCWKDIDKEWIQLCGWILTDGYIRKKWGNIILYQKKEKGKKEIRKILNNLGFNYVEYIDKRPKGNPGEMIMFYIKAKDSRKVLKILCLNSQKDTPKWLKKLNFQQVLWFLEAVIMGDGHKRKSETAIAGTEKRLKDFSEILKTVKIKHSVSCNKRGDWCLRVFQGYNKRTLFDD